tara:strand:+ start:962 stop:1921 length:960 start_codon:yes stop_codon:yes gene_type:complete
MKVLVTGSNGFIGKNLVSQLKNNKDISLTLSSRVSSRFSEGNINQFILTSIDSSTDWKEILEDIDIVIHLAGIAHNNYSNFKSGVQDEYRKINVEATLNLANQAIRANVKRFIYLSSIKVNGEATVKNRPFTAEDVPNPQDLYAKLKLEAEISLKKITTNSKTELVIIRPVLVYGPGVKGNLLSLIKWIKFGIPLPLRSIENKRSFVSIRNLVDFINICLEHPYAANQVFLVSDNSSISTSRLIRKLAIFLKKRLILIPFPQKILKFILIILGKKEMAHKLLGSLEVNIQKNQELLGWKPIQTVDTALEEMTDYFSKND